MRGPWWCRRGDRRCPGVRWRDPRLLPGDDDCRRGRSGAQRRKTTHDITIVKHIDKSSAKLYQACATGKHFAKATLTLRKSGGGKSSRRIYLAFTFKLVASG